MVQRWRKKPVVIEAIQFDGSTANIREIAAWAREPDPGPSGTGVPIQFAGPDYNVGPTRLWVETSEGTMTASVGDWIIKGVKGEFYPCRNDVFEATYEPAG